MATLGPWELIEKADGKTLATIAGGSIGGLIYAWGQGAIEMSQAAISVLVDPVVAMVGGTVDLVGSLYGGWVDIIEAGTRTSVQALAPGSQWAIGPFTQGVALVSVFLGLFLVAKFIAQRWSSNFVPGILVDNRIIAFLSTTPEEDEQGET